MIPDAAQIIIIGAGAMGASTAYYLAQKGYSNIVVLEKENYLGGHTTSRCAGGFRYQFSNEINVQLSKLNIQELELFKREHKCKYELNKCGYLFLLTKDDNIDKFKSSVKMQNKLGIDTKWLESDDIRKMIPMMNTDDVVSGTFYEGDGLVDPSDVVNAYIEESKKLGVKYFNDVKVTSIELYKDSAKRVITNKGSINCSIIVNAAGPWASEIGKMVGVYIPIKPVKQQLFFTSKVSWMSKKFPVVIFQNEGLGFHREGNGILTGLNKPQEESINYNLDVDEEWKIRHCEKAIKRIPTMENLSIVSEWAGFYEVTEDDLPILGRIPQVEGFYCIAGFSGHGFMHSSICGKLLSEEIIYGTTRSLDITSLRINRFDESQCNMPEYYKI
ncbi:MULTISPECIES: NAD(P)/FAD-dependent oxidoreductase [Clostridium]|uniref:NAD(P)/FAD-dependent oxidoreductase n=1 Tax=Clostridium TaxID=1485 RepID=UPI000826B57C|nr:MULTISPECIES: FAD-dependent oxidoreductase [Clostridium]PJI06507.1 FAD-dependent oxidoreductase [Clostridium sp. CT7]